MKKVELLAPAGNYECFLAALNAGADAVYLGGTKFGARAYADNFTEEEICKAITVAHLWGRKVYLTLNTLLKETELKEVADYVRPLYECGLDGVIIQDLGVFTFLKKHFPGMELHCSTQMTITGRYGAAFAKNLGASRIVPARELSLMEIKSIHKTVDIEIEAFIHGAMCYCYSGQCLFSSILGGRSGNRGKCAQPCRLPYKIDSKAKKEAYPLSLKDMCTIEHIPSLIEAGISSFKIEGRMKRPEYVAGVTGIYRKYMDLYYENPNREWKIEKEDLHILHSLYIRSQVQDGYYFRHNGKEMITLNQPGYSGNDEEILKQIREKYLSEKLQIPVTAVCNFKLNQPAELTLSSNDTSVTVYGQEVAEAQKVPVTEDNIKTQVLKMGNTNFSCEQIQVNAEQHIFYPMKALNELRRTAVQALEQKLLEKQGADVKNRHFTEASSAIIKQDSVSSAKSKETGNIYVSVRTEEQFFACLKEDFADAVIWDTSICETNKEWSRMFKVLSATRKQKSILIAMPYIIRKKDTAFLEEMWKVLNHENVDGCLFRNLETYEFLKEKHFSKTMIADTNLYVFNKEAYSFWKNEGVSITFPLELNAGEIRHLRQEGVSGMKVVYGRIPMMITANCIQKTADGCTKAGAKRFLTDRYNVSFPVITDCKHCYNIIYNSTPLSLHKTYPKLLNQSDCMLVFTTESKEETLRILLFYKSLVKVDGKEAICPIQEYTTGHEKRGVD